MNKNNYVYSIENFIKKMTSIYFILKNIFKYYLINIKKIYLKTIQIFTNFYKKPISIKN